MEDRIVRVFGKNDNYFPWMDKLIARGFKCDEQMRIGNTLMIFTRRVRH